jgi:hypothetical protein
MNNLDLRIPPLNKHQKNTTPQPKSKAGKAAGKYGDCVMHVRTVHVPRFEVEINASRSPFQQSGNLMRIFGISKATVLIGQLEIHYFSSAC